MSFASDDVDDLEALFGEPLGDERRSSATGPRTTVRLGAAPASPATSTKSLREILGGTEAAPFHRRFRAGMNNVAVAAAMLVSIVLAVGVWRVLFPVVPAAAPSDWLRQSPPAEGSSAPTGPVGEVDEPVVVTIAGAPAPSVAGSSASSIAGSSASSIAGASAASTATSTTSTSTPTSTTTPRSSAAVSPPATAPAAPRTTTVTTSTTTSTTIGSGGPATTFDDDDGADDSGRGSNSGSSNSGSSNSGSSNSGSSNSGSSNSGSSNSGSSNSGRGSSD